MASVEQEHAQLAGHLQEQTRRNERLTDQLAAATGRADHAEATADQERDARQTAEHISQTAQSRADRAESRAEQLDARLAAAGELAADYARTATATRRTIHSPARRPGPP